MNTHVQKSRLAMPPTERQNKQRVTPRLLSAYTGSSAWEKATVTCDYTMADSGIAGAAGRPVITFGVRAATATLKVVSACRCPRGWSFDLGHHFAATLVGRVAVSPAPLGSRTFARWTRQL